MELSKEDPLHSYSFPWYGTGEIHYTLCQKYFDRPFDEIVEGCRIYCKGGGNRNKESAIKKMTTRSKLLHHLPNQISQR